MLERKSTSSPTLRLTSFILFIAILLSACESIPTSSPSPVTPPFIEGQSSPPLAEITFRVSLPAPVAKDEKLLLEVVDEVTGLALNTVQYAMSSTDGTAFQLNLPVQLGSVLKYRYVRQGKTTHIEYTSQGNQIRYRLFHVINPATVSDVVRAWNDQPSKGPFGRIQGQVFDSATNAPIPGTLVSAGGQQTLTSSDGSFLLEGLPKGIHNLVAYSLNGSFSTFQQEAEVDNESATPVIAKVNPAKTVQVTFAVHQPANTPAGIPVRIVGNILSLGNTFADLRGGISTIASRAPLLSYNKDGSYQIVLTLPVGLDLQYKYTLGDGFWNAELTKNFNPRLRQLIVPDKNITLEDNIDAWSQPGSNPVTFKVTVPPETPNSDIVSLQLNPYGWTEPIPMWSMGEHQWLYILYNPTSVLENATYRYCRNDQCGIADDSATTGQDSNGKPIKLTKDALSIQDTIKKWAWIEPEKVPVTVTSDPITPKSTDFITGIAFPADFHPSWLSYLNPAFENIQGMRSSHTILTPTWHFTNTNPPVLSPVTGIDPSWFDLGQMVNRASEKSLQVGLHPLVGYYQPADTWWLSAKRDAGWWQSWFDRYQTFLLNFADLASISGVKLLILGDPTISPALPGGQTVDGASSGVPQEADQRWREIIQAVRSHYSGTLAWNLHYPSDFKNLPPFLSEVDVIYVTMEGPLTQQTTTDTAEIRNGASKIIEGDLLALRDQYKKPFLLGIAYPSAKGASTACIQSSGACLPLVVLAQAGLDLPSVETDLNEQSAIYNAIFEVINQNQWLDGVISEGYYPVTILEDKSTSINGKPAGDVTWFWFDHLRNTTTP